MAGDRGGVRVAARMLDDEAVRDFESRLRGRLVRPSDADYDQVRAVWNGMIDRRPALVARCAGTADVIEAVRFARRAGVPVSVRGGGHNVAGGAVCDDGLVIDLSPMKGVRVDPDTRTVWAQGGVTIGELDRETQAFELAVPMGVVTETGIAGLTLGGGLGWLRRAYGASCDNLLSADVVTADGRLVTADATHEPDLLWALKGGGGDFGVVTAFDFRAHLVGPDVYFAFVVHPGRCRTSGSGPPPRPTRSAPSRSCGTRRRSTKSRLSTTARRSWCSRPCTAARSRGERWNCARCARSDSRSPTSRSRRRTWRYSGSSTRTTRPM